MKTRLNQRGFATWELALVVLVIAFIAFAGYHVYNARKVATSAPSTTVSSSTAAATGATTPATTVAPTITNTTGLDQATAALNQNDPSSSNATDSSQLSSQANF